MALDQDLASGMAKLTRASFAVKVIKMPSALAKARAQLDAFTDARDAKDEGFLERAKVKLGLGIQTPNLDNQVKVFQARVDALQNDVIDAVLTPLQERENWAVRAHFAHIGLYLRGQLVRPGDTDEIKAANAAADKAVDLIGEQVWMSKWIGYSLKRPKVAKTAAEVRMGPLKAKSDGQVETDTLEPYFKDCTIPPDVEPGVIVQLYNAYHEAFRPTEAELKK